MQYSDPSSMRVRLELEVDLTSGVYDVRFQNLSQPGDKIDLNRLTQVVARVLENVALKTAEVEQAASRPKRGMN